MSSSVGSSSSSSPPKDNGNDAVLQNGDAVQQNSDAVQQNPPARPTLNQGLIKLEGEVTANSGYVYSLCIDFEGGLPYKIFTASDFNQLRFVNSTDDTEGRLKGLYIPMFVSSTDRWALTTIATAHGLRIFEQSDDDE